MYKSQRNTVCRESSREHGLHDQVIQGLFLSEISCLRARYGQLGGSWVERRKSIQDRLGKEKSA